MRTNAPFSVKHITVCPTKNSSATDLQVVFPLLLGKGLCESTHIHTIGVLSVMNKSMPFIHSSFKMVPFLIYQVRPYRSHPYACMTWIPATPKIFQLDNKHKYVMLAQYNFRTLIQKGTIKKHPPGNSLFVLQLIHFYLLLSSSKCQSWNRSHRRRTNS